MLSVSIPPSVTEPTVISKELVDELAQQIRGPVVTRANPEFFQRSLTFNGKIKCLSKIVVSPLDANDVSAIVLFCAKHGLSPSVRAGGYGIAGWSVAGDIIIDMSMIKDIDIEAPIPVSEDSGGGTTYTKLKDMPAPGSKGKGRIGITSQGPATLQMRATTNTITSSTNTAPATVGAAEGDNGENPINRLEGADRPPVPGSPPAIVDPLAPRSGNPKRRREDRDETPPGENVIAPGTGISIVGGLPVGVDAHLHAYDSASRTVGVFLRGPPLPEIPGEIPREPPLNRRRIHSPVVGDEESAVIGKTLASEGRQLSGESAASSGKVSTPESISSRERSVGTTGTTPGESPGGEKPSPVGTGAASTTTAPQIDPFSYLSNAQSSSHPPGGGASNPASSSPALQGHFATSASAPFPTTGGSPWQRPFGPGPSSSIWSSGVSSSSVSSGATPFGIPNPFMAAASGSPFPPTPGSFSVPMSHHMGMGLGMGVGLGMGMGIGMGMGGIAPPAEPIHSHAYVTFGAGMRQKEVDLYTAEHPLEGISRVTGGREEGLVPYHIPSSAHPVGSSIMLLAGFGFLSRMYGLSIDNLVELEMVLADGRIVIVNKEDDPELWWAIRGGGPAFGIATRYKVKAFPVPIVFAGNLVYRFHRATAPSLIKHFRDCIKGAPRELYANVLLTAGPADKDSLVVIQMCYVGPKEKGIEFLQAISSWDGERCLLNEVNEKSFLNQQDSVAQVLRGKMGRQWFIRSSLIHSLPDEVINNTVLQFANTPIGCSGAIMDYEDNCLPKEQREAAWTVAALHQWEMGIDDPRCITSAEDWMRDTIGPVALGGPFPTFLGRHEPPSRTMACYGKNWSRLAELKRRYDPTGLFKNNFWPLDKDGEPIELLYNEPPSPDME